MHTFAIVVMPTSRSDFGVMRAVVLAKVPIAWCLILS